MKPKKPILANLEKARQIFFQTGYVISLAFVLVAFEWNRETKSYPTKCYSPSLWSEVTDVSPSVSQHEEAVDPSDVQIFLNLVPYNADIPDILQFCNNSSVGGNVLITFRVQKLSGPFIFLLKNCQKVNQKR